MTKENAKDYLPLVQALAEGKTIQHKKHGVWFDWREPFFSETPDQYRIKPSPKRVPLTMDDWNGGTWWVKWVNEFLVVAFDLDRNGVDLAFTPQGTKFYSFSDLMSANAQRSTDREHWTPCWKEIEE